MEKNLWSVKPSAHFSDEENYSGSTPYVSSDSDTDSDASKFIIKPSVKPAAAASASASVVKPFSLSGLVSLPKHPNPYVSDEEESEPDLKLSDIAAEARASLKKCNGGPGKARSKPGASESDTPDGSPARKRAAAGSAAEAKRLKKAGVEGSGRKPHNLFRRIFSEDDEIAILKGMISFESEKHADPFADVSAFKVFVKPELQSDPNVDQLLLKMRKLKTKYEKNKRKEESGKPRNLKVHERRAYDISKLVNWNYGKKGGKSAKTPKPATKRMAAKKTKVQTANAGGDNEAAVNVAAVNGGAVNGGAVNGAAVNGGAVNVAAVTVAAVNGDFPKLAEIVNWNHSTMDRIGVRLFEGENRAEGEAEWHKLQMKEIELQRKMLELISAKSKLVSRALKTENYSQ